jgi:hypothetical protein
LRFFQGKIENGGNEGKKLRLSAFFKAQGTEKTSSFGFKKGAKNCSPQRLLGIKPPRFPHTCKYQGK